MSGYIDINSIEKSSPITAINAAAATTTSAPIDARGKNAVLLKITIAEAAQNWTIKLQGCFTRNGTYIDLYEQANTGNMVAMSHQTNVSRMILFKGMPDYIKVVATEDVDGAKCSVDVQLLNV
jgi:hypothetical protein